MSIKIKPRHARVDAGDLAREAVLAHQRGSLARAEKLYRLVLQAQPDNFAAMHLLGTLLHQRGKPDAAVPLLESAIRLNPHDAEMHNNLGIALIASKRFEEARTSFERALALDPSLAGAHSNLGVALYQLKRFEAAVASYRRALELQPRNAEALDNLGLALLESGAQSEAVENFRSAIAIRPDWALAQVHLGNALAAQKSYVGAIEAFENALLHDPQHGYAKALRTFLKRQICDWSNHDEEVKALTIKGGDWRKDRDLPSPLIFLSLTDDPRLQFDCAKAYASQYRTAYAARPSRSRGPRTSGKIRLAYLSPDFRQHATSFLLADLIEAHDRSRFEVVAISYGPDDGSALRRRMVGAFDQFIEVTDISDGEVVARMRELEIDIAVDLSGYTTLARTPILAARPAPIQVSYLAYPGTTGADWIDYVITDPFLTPDEFRPFFSERFAVLPDSFQVNSLRAIPAEAPSRAQCALPEDAFVFCSWNNLYKITPALFDVWMRLLGAIPGSVLWLLGENTWAVENLRRAAGARGIDPDRLVFAPKAPYAEHLARHRHADLFLDTLPYNAATTASDALWAGVPLLTCPGRSFVSRIGGSLLNAVGLPELVAPSLPAYEARALQLARNLDELHALRRRLEESRTARLFNPPRFRRHIEAAYTTMWEAWQAGSAPKAFAVDPVAD